MSNKKYIDFATGTITGTSLILIADPVTGQLSKVDISALSTFLGTTGGGSSTPPTVVSAIATGSTNIQVVFSQSMTTVTTSGWSAKKNGTAWTISSVTGSGTTWDFTMSTSAVNTDILLISYNSTTGATASASGALASFTDRSVTNSIAGYDADASAFFTAAGITDTTQKNAVNQLVLDLKAASIWTKMKAIYPFVGGTSSTHAVNLKTPGTYNLTFTGGWTHASTGALPNGSTGYASTGIIMSSVLAQFSSSISMYSRTATAPGAGTDKMVMGVIFGSQYTLDFNADGTPNLRTDGCANDKFATVSSASTYTKLIGFSRTANNSLTMYRDGSSIATNTTTATATLPSTHSIYLGAANNSGTAAYFAPYEFAFAHIGDGLTGTEWTSLNNAVNTYQTTLTRNV